LQRWQWLSAAIRLLSNQLTQAMTLSESQRNQAIEDWMIASGSDFFQASALQLEEEQWQRLADMADS